jgi:hypothetical protein
VRPAEPGVARSNTRRTHLPLDLKHYATLRRRCSLQSRLVACEGANAVGLLVVVAVRWGERPPNRGVAPSNTCHGGSQGHGDRSAAMGRDGVFRSPRDIQHRHAEQLNAGSRRGAHQAGQHHSGPSSWPRSGCLALLSTALFATRRHNPSSSCHPCGSRSSLAWCADLGVAPSNTCHGPICLESWRRWASWRAPG